MIDNIELLEQKIERLIERMESLKTALTHAEDEKGSLSRQLEESTREISRLHNECSHLHKREELIKAKLEKVVKRLEILDSLVGELKST